MCVCLCDGSAGKSSLRIIHQTLLFDKCFLMVSKKYYLVVCFENHKVLIVAQILLTKTTQKGPKQLIRHHLKPTNMTGLSINIKLFH